MHTYFHDTLCLAGKSTRHAVNTHSKQHVWTLRACKHITFFKEPNQFRPELNSTHPVTCGVCMYTIDSKLGQRSGERTNTSYLCCHPWRHNEHGRAVQGGGSLIRTKNIPSWSTTSQWVQVNKTFNLIYYTIYISTDLPVSHFCFI